MFIQEVLADVSAGSSAGSMLTSMAAPSLIIIAVFYFLVILPQQKKLKNHQYMVNNLKKGDQIVTAGGMVATVSKVETESDILVVEIAKDVKVKIKKDTVSQILNVDKSAK
ncbi:MAG: preprotein translocase subunit YajC [Rickettsiales bacterium]|jgi:preprotein translocase subunit YajC|nr:preprotein translocase subunit YajC [Rickettsiales bacterium]